MYSPGAMVNRTVPALGTCGKIVYDWFSATNAPTDKSSGSTAPIKSNVPEVGNAGVRPLPFQLPLAIMSQAPTPLQSLLGTSV